MSLGACVAIMAVEFGIYPEKNPISNRKLISHQTLGTKASPPIVTVITKLARIIIGFRPYLSASRPQTGATTPEANAGREKAKPEKKATLPPVTPKLLIYKDIKGITKEKEAPTTKQPSQVINKFRFQSTSSSFPTSFKRVIISSYLSLTLVTSSPH